MFIKIRNVNGNYVKFVKHLFEKKYSKQKTLRQIVIFQMKEVGIWR